MRALFLILFAAVTLCAGTPAFAQPKAPAAPAADDPALAQAKAHFLRGVDHTDRGEWDAALAEFLKSREILPTAKNTYNAAVCLRKVNRFDEALDMYEALLRDFPNLSTEERQVAERELAQLKTSVGAIELRGGVPGATVIIDTRERGTLPLAAPLRVGAGTHAVRVARDGYLPFEARVTVVGMQTLTVNVQLATLAAGGRLHVAEQTGKTLDVVVDNAVVGKTPWDGVLPPGDHTVLLRGEGQLGTQPVAASVKLNQTVTLNLLAEELGATLRVQPRPPTATVSIDGIVVGHGAWEGRLRPGTHTVEVAADGYLPFRREMTTSKDGADAVDATLTRDPNAFAEPSATFAIEIDAAMPIGALWGGDVTAQCTGGCSPSLPLGLHGVLHGIYQTGSGFGGGLDAGYLVAFRDVGTRNESLQPVGAIPPNQGTVDDTLRLSGLTFGASGQYRSGTTWPVLVRLGAGLLLGSVRDARVGSLTNSKNERYNVDLQRSAPATYVYVAPEVRIGRRFGSHLELSIGAEILVMTALSQPKWTDNRSIQTGVPTSPDPRGDGGGTFGSDSLTGSFMLLVAPGLGARYDF